MPGTLVAAAATADASVQLTLAWPGAASATVTRVASDGTIVNVRNAEPAQCDAAGAWIGSDYEAPLDLDCTYQATSTDSPGEVVASNTVAIPSGGDTVWLRHPGRPALNTRIILATAPKLTRGIPLGVHTILERPRPVATAGRRQSPAGTLAVRTDTPATRDALEVITADGTVLLLSTPLTWGLGPNLYLALGEVEEDRVLQYGPHPARIWAAPFTVVDRPVGAALASGNSWSDVLGAYGSWQDLAAAKPTWADVLAGGF